MRRPPGLLVHTQTLTFPGSQGAPLAARLDLPPQDEPLGCAILAHCFTCSKQLNAVVNLSRALTREGMAVLRFDFTGLGESGGDLATTNFSSTVADLVAAAEFLAARGLPPMLLAGHSLGGAAAVVAAPRIPSLRALATLCAPSDPWHLARLLGVDEGSPPAEEALVDLGGQPFRVTRQLLEDLKEASVEQALHRIELPLLVLHSPEDGIVEISHATRLFRAARGPRSFVSLDGADHLLSRREDADYAGRVIAAWASRFLPRPEDPPVEALIDQGRVTAVTHGGAFRTEIAVGRHRLVADEPVAVGGADAGPSPYDLLLAGLGACTGMTLHMYAARKGWPLEEATVRLKHGKVHAIDDEHAGEPGARVDHVEREVVLEGPLSEEQRARLLEIANKCPVHRTLEAGVRTTTRLGQSPSD
jgi:uncharacterized OsmC-like protein/alpha-beta hydrolase superfamily lysophospholipase